MKRPLGFEDVEGATGTNRRSRDGRRTVECHKCGTPMGKSQFYDQHRFLCQGPGVPDREPDYTTASYRERYNGASREDRGRMPPAEQPELGGDGEDDEMEVVEEESSREGGPGDGEGEVPGSIGEGQALIFLRGGAASAVCAAAVLLLTLSSDEAG